MSLIDEFITNTFIIHSAYSTVHTYTFREKCQLNYANMPQLQQNWQWVCRVTCCNTILFYYRAYRLKNDTALACYNFRLTLNDFDFLAETLLIK